MATAAPALPDAVTRTLRALARLAIQGRAPEASEAAKNLKELTLFALTRSSAPDAECDDVRGALRELFVALKPAMAGNDPDAQRELVRRAQTMKEKLLDLLPAVAESGAEGDAARLATESMRLLALTESRDVAVTSPPPAAPQIASSVSPRPARGTELPTSPWGDAVISPTAPAVETSPAAAPAAAKIDVESSTKGTASAAPASHKSPETHAVMTTSESAMDEADELLNEFSMDRSIKNPRGSFLDREAELKKTQEFMDRRRPSTKIVADADALIRDLKDVKSPLHEWHTIDARKPGRVISPSHDDDAAFPVTSPFTPPLSPLSPSGDAQSPSRAFSPNRRDGALSPEPPMSPNATALMLPIALRTSLEKNKVLESMVVGEEGREFLSAFLTMVPMEVQDELATAVLLVYMRNGRERELIKWAVESEVAKCTNEATLFRGSEIQSRILSAYGRTLGTAYLFQILDPTMEEVCRGASLEIDENRLSPGEDLQRNINRFGKLIERVMDDVTKSAAACPMPLRVMYALVQQAVVAKFPQMRHRCVGGQFFLRFLCPALTVPDAFAFRKKSDEPTAASEAKAIALAELPPKALENGARLDDKARRSLVLLSKFLQSIANEITVVKETFMAPLQPLLGQYIGRVHNFFDQLVNIPEAELTASRPLPALLSEDVCARAIRQIKKLMRLYLDRLKKSPIVTSAMDPLVKEAESLCAASTSPDELASPRILNAHQNMVQNSLFKSMAANADDIESKRQERILLRQQSEFMHADTIGRKAGRSSRDGAGKIEKEPSGEKDKKGSKIKRPEVTKELSAEEREERKRREREDKESAKKREEDDERREREEKEAAKRREAEEKEAAKRREREEEERRKAQEDKEREARIAAVKAKMAVAPPSAFEIVAKASRREDFAVAEKKAPKKFAANLVVLHEKTLYVYDNNKAPQPRYSIPLNKWTHVAMQQTPVGAGFTVYGANGQWWFANPVGHVITSWVTAVEKAIALPG